MSTPKKPARPALLRVPDLPSTLEALEKAIKDQQEALDASRELHFQKKTELETLQKERSAAVAPAAPEASIDEFREPFAKAMVEVSVALWRIRQSIEKLDESKETRRVQRDLANCLEALKSLGVETIDRANADLNTGIYRDMEVISNEMTSEVTQVTVSEVIKPAVHFRVLHPLLRKANERPDQPPFIVQKCQVVTKSPPVPEA